MADTLKAAKAQLAKARSRLTHAETALQTLLNEDPTYTALRRKHTDLLDARVAHETALDRVVELTDDEGAAGTATADFNTLDNRIATINDQTIAKLELLQAGLDRHGAPLPSNADRLAEQRVPGMDNGKRLLPSLPPSRPPSRPARATVPLPLRFFKCGRGS